MNKNIHEIKPIQFNLEEALKKSTHADIIECFQKYGKNCHYIIQMQSMEKMDHHGLGVLMLIRELAGGENAKIELSGCNQQVKKVLTMANLQKLFQIH